MKYKTKIDKKYKVRLALKEGIKHLKVLKKEYMVGTGIKQDDLNEYMLFKTFTEYTE